MFDQLKAADIASIMAVNAPVAERATPDLINRMRAEAAPTQTVTLSDGTTCKVGKQLPPRYLVLDKASIEALFGFRPAKEGEIARFWPGGKKKDSVGYVADWNHSNRPHILSNHALLAGAIAAGTYVSPTPEVWIFLDDGQCGSAQHRGWAWYERMLSDNEATVTALVSFGFSADLADVLDRAAKRSNASIIARNNVIDESLFLTETPQEDGTTKTLPIIPNVAATLATLSREMNAVCKIVSLRGHGKDIKASGQFSAGEMGKMLDKMPDLPQLMRDVYLAGRDASGQDALGVRLFGRPNIVAALVLSANTDNPPEIHVTESGKREFTLPDEIFLPEPEVVEGFMSVLSRSDANAEFASAFAKWQGATNKHPQRRFGVLLGLLQQFLATRTVDEVPPAVDAATGQPLPGAVATTRWTCQPVDFKSIDPDGPKKKERGGDAPPPYQWTAYGGLDVGYLPPIK